MATSVIHFSDFTSVQLRYIWGSDDGRDLDTKSYYVNSPIDSLNYMAVGWSWHLSQIPYLYWGGDNTIMLVNSAVLAPVFWSWVVSPILKKLGVGYKDIDNTIG
ncbi:hypothetical protein [Intestinibacter bartlettii]|uniref:hypothetical protein n=1 Tax=Intestinibacter bartlettii TaxID=261299 RepID=UPI00248BF584|nr:hypothetical protein [Intestinibacter bartlettii]